MVLLVTGGMGVATVARDAPGSHQRASFLRFPGAEINQFMGLRGPRELAMFFGFDAIDFLLLAPGLLLALCAQMQFQSHRES